MNSGLFWFVTQWLKISYRLFASPYRPQFQGSENVDNNSEGRNSHLPQGCSPKYIVELILLAWCKNFLVGMCVVVIVFAQSHSDTHTHHTYTHPRRHTHTTLTPQTPSHSPTHKPHLHKPHVHKPHTHTHTHTHPQTPHISHTNRTLT